MAIKTCKLNNEMDDKGRTDKFLEEACMYARNMLFWKPCSIETHQILHQQLFIFLEHFKIVLKQMAEFFKL